MLSPFGHHVLCASSSLSTAVGTLRPWPCESSAPLPWVPRLHSGIQAKLTLVPADGGAAKTEEGDVAPRTSCCDPRPPAEEDSSWKVPSRCLLTQKLQPGDSRSPPPTTRGSRDGWPGPLPLPWIMSCNLPPSRSSLCPISVGTPRNKSRHPFLLIIFSDVFTPRSVRQEKKKKKERKKKRKRNCLIVALKEGMVVWLKAFPLWIRLHCRYCSWTPNR